MKRLLICLWAVLALAACSAPPGDERVTLITPDPALFEQVSPVLGSYCGSLDCHGTRLRNLTIYSINGLRLDAVSGSGSETTEETAANFGAVVMLEPEQLALVMRDGGGNPERLTIVRKARGTEHHKGGGQLPLGSDGDRCLTSWLTNALDATACEQAKERIGPTP
jgi:hypothetical protein